jgi:hypothetical protein
MEVERKDERKEGRREGERNSAHIVLYDKNKWEM